MGHALRALLMFAVLASVLALTGAAQEEQRGDVTPASQPVAQEPKGEPAGPPLEDYKLPDNALVIIADSLAKAQKLIPGGFYVSPAKFKEFQDLEARVKQLENQLKPKKLKPHKCQLTGQLQGDFLDLEAKYVLVTPQPNSLVALGLHGAFLTKADMGGQFPLLQHTAEGWVVQVPRPGHYDLTLHLRLPVKTSREEVLAAGIERTVTVGLPGAAVVPPLELKLPAAIKELRWNELVEKQPISQGTVNLWKVPLMGDLDKVKLRWKEQAGAAVKGTITSASWEVTVQLLKKQALTTANLTLHDTRGKPTDWRLLVPKGATVEIKGADLSFLPTPEKDFAESALVRIKGPPAQQLEVVVQVAQERHAGKRLAVGPFLVLGADRQQGRFEIQATTDVLQGHRVVYHKHVDLRPLDPSENGPKKNGENVIDRFEAWDLAQGVAAPQPANAGKIGPPLELELKTLEAQVETRVEHTLRVQPAREGWNLVVLTKIHATPLFSVDFLDVKLPEASFPGTLPVLPAPATFTANPADVVAWLAHDPAWPVQPVGEFSATGEGTVAGAHLLPAPEKDGVHRIDLKKQQTAPFTVTLTRLYKVAPQANQVRLPLPRPVSLSDKGAKVAVEMEDDRLELIALATGTSAAQKQKRQVTSDWKFAPEAVNVAWQPYQLQLPVTLVADVTLQSRFASVRQELKFDLTLATGATPIPLRLIVPPGVQGLKVVGGGPLPIGGDGVVTVEAPAQEPLVLQFDFPLPHQPEAADGPAQDNAPGDMLVNFSVPLVWPEQATRCEAKVRFWSEFGLVPSIPLTMPGNEVWKDTGVEEVADRDSLPVRVVQTDQPRPTLTCVLQHDTTAPWSGAIVDRALMKVEMTQGGKYRLRARFLITRLDADKLDILFPVPLARLKQSLTFHLGEKRIPYQVLADGATARLAVNPKMYSGPTLLDVRFDVEPEESSLLRFGQVLLHAPRIQGDVHVGRVRWQIVPLSGPVPLVLGGQAHAAQHWKWQGWLFTPESQVSGDDLESWITQQPAGAGPDSAGIVFWATETDAVRVVLVPRQFWLLLCSAAFLLFGLGISFLPARRFWGWLLVAALGACLLLVGMLWPGLLAPLLYGVQPGVVVLTLILLLQWLMHQRYRRQMLFMPGFARMRKGSSISRRGPTAERQTSTLDAGPQVGSSRIGP